MLVPVYNHQGKWKAEHKKSLFKTQVPKRKWSNLLTLKSRHASYGARHIVTWFFFSLCKSHVRKKGLLSQPKSAVQGRCTLTLHVINKLQLVSLKTPTDMIFWRGDSEINQYLTVPSILCCSSSRHTKITLGLQNTYVSIPSEDSIHKQGWWNDFHTFSPTWINPPSLVLH